MKNWIYLVSIASTIMIVGPLLTEKAFAWMLTVNLTDKPFGHARAWVQVQGPNGYVDSKWSNWNSISTGTSSGTVTWNLPDSQFPDNSQYIVCASSNEVLAFVSPNCVSGFHYSGDESITVSLE